MTTKFFQKTGVDISSPKSMFEFINNHFKYFTMNSWNCSKSIANNVKVYKLDLSGDEWVALAFLQSEEYDTVNQMINDWEHKHSGYTVGFNGRSGGYLVLYNRDNNGSIVPEEIDGYDSYEDWVEDLHGYGYRISDFMYTLRNTVAIIRAFDELCDEIREYVDALSNMDFSFVQMWKYVDAFNDQYSDDLETLGYNELTVRADGIVDISEIQKLNCLLAAFISIIQEAKEVGYSYQIDQEKGTAKLIEK